MKATIITGGIRIDVLTGWTVSAVCGMCFKYKWYRRGSTASFQEMLDFVESNEPTTENIYRVAKDIYDHSEFTDGDTSSIMETIHDEVVRCFYEVEG